MMIFVLFVIFFSSDQKFEKRTEPIPTRSENECFAFALNYAAAEESLAEESEAGAELVVVPLSATKE